MGEVVAFLMCLLLIAGIVAAVIYFVFFHKPKMDGYKQGLARITKATEEMMALDFPPILIGHAQQVMAMAIGKKYGTLTTGLDLCQELLTAIVEENNSIFGRAKYFSRTNFIPQVGGKAMSLITEYKELLEDPTMFDFVFQEQIKMAVASTGDKASASDVQASLEKYKKGKLPISTTKKDLDLS